ncbi:uncharacterized protein [Montipora foliosa]|uniref:uncharacterized protein n=1 Tax=Montipora foliosa TaxID=591990 RepID=UPI0035F1FD7C
MADERRILAVSVLFCLLSALAAAFQCCGFLLSLLMIQSFRQRQLTAQATQQYNASVARLLRIRRRINRRGRMWRSSGRTEQWWLNLFNVILPEREWKKNLRMNRAVFMSVADELRPFLQPGRSPRGLDVLSVEKQLAITLYFLKDQGSLTMTANAFGVAHCTVSVVVRKVCNIITDVLGPRYIKLPNTVQEMKELIDGMENKYGFPQAFGCVDGTHIPIAQPSENPHDYFSYKLKYTLNVQRVCDWKGLFLDVDVKWPGSVHDGRVFGNSRINRLLREERLPMCYKEILPGYENIPVTLLEDPAYPLLPYCMKEFPNTRTNEEVIFNNMLRSARNPIECAYGRLKARWQILNKRNDMGLNVIPSIIYACFVLHNICELQGMNVEDDVVAQQMARDRLAQPENAPDRLYSFNTAEGAYVRNIITSFYKEHIPH